jgi:hypothetical protein
VQGEEDDDEGDEDETRTRRGGVAVKPATKPSFSPLPRRHLKDCQSTL